jgi:hypothetical protein
MTDHPTRRALYYPFHLCREETLLQLLEDYDSVHFRDYMALQITPLSGTTAYQDRMGDAYPDLVKSGRIVQGYPVSGPLAPVMIAAIDCDLSDEVWRTEFHRALSADRRFQRGLFDLSHGVVIGDSLVPGPAALLRLIEAPRQSRPYRVQSVKDFSGRRLSIEDGYDYEYALALVKTSAALLHTVRLCLEHGFEAVTDSEAHYRLLKRTRERDRLPIEHRWLVPQVR